jgi:hypothetical protein
LTNYKKKYEKEQSPRHFILKTMEDFFRDITLRGWTSNLFTGENHEFNYYQAFSKKV